MSYKVIKIREGEVVPENAKYLSSGKELRKDKTRYEWRNSPGIMGMIPIFGTETLYAITPQEVVHYYEVEQE